MKRYDLEWTGTAYSQIREMLEDPDGDWVLWEDHKTKVDKLVAALKKGRDIMECSYCCDYDQIEKGQHCTCGAVDWRHEIDALLAEEDASCE